MPLFFTLWSMLPNKKKTLKVDLATYVEIQACERKKLRIGH